MREPPKNAQHSQEQHADSDPLVPVHESEAKGADRQRHHEPAHSERARDQPGDQPMQLNGGSRVAIEGESWSGCTHRLLGQRLDLFESGIRALFIDRTGLCATDAYGSNDLITHLDRDSAGKAQEIGIRRDLSGE
jgi:hypothetical protein